MMTGHVHGLLNPQPPAWDRQISIANRLVAAKRLAVAKFGRSRLRTASSPRRLKISLAPAAMGLLESGESYGEK